MDSTILSYIVIGILVLEYSVDNVLNYLNAKKFQDPIPPELEDVFNEEEYLKSQNYKKTNYSFGILSATFSLVLTLSFLIFGGFHWADQWSAGLTENTLLHALLFFGIILFGSNILSIPFSYYQTFVIEEKFGFNQTTLKLFCIDTIKGWVITALLGGGLLSLIIVFFQWAGTAFWWYAWALVTVVILFMNLFYSKLIVPIFNTQEPLKEGALKTSLQSYAKTVGFAIHHIFVIDGSKRSTKANAYFSGFGNEKRVTLYDTLIKDLEEEEIVAVLAHEVGHYKKKHQFFNLFASILLTGLTLFVLSLFVNTPELSLAIGVTTPSFHAALIGFGILYSPISAGTGFIMNYWSRKFEYQADDYAKNTFKAAALISGLKKLSKNSLSNLTPHPSYVFMHYSHPPLIDRIRNLKV